MSTKEVAKLIKKYGQCKEKPIGRVPGLYSVICQKCGKEILTDEPDLNDVGYSITRRGNSELLARGM